MLPKVNVKVDEPALPTTIAVGPGTGGGTGNDGTSGNGPGTGGGVGTGVGTGRGSGNGPGTGGGEGTIYPATPDFLLMPSLPVPKHVQGKTLVLRFSIDERGRILKVDFDSSGDGGYDRQLRQRFSEYRFRPAHKRDGTPVPSIYVAQLTL
jgi:protein TonB